VTNFKG